MKATLTLETGKTYNTEMSKDGDVILIQFFSFQLSDQYISSMYLIFQ
jgi:hypothetical protein